MKPYRFRLGKAYFFAKIFVPYLTTAYTNEENSFPETESKLFILDGLEHRIRPSKFDSPYDLYDDDEGKKIN